MSAIGQVQGEQNLYRAGTVNSERRALVSEREKRRTVSSSGHSPVIYLLSEYFNWRVRALDVSSVIKSVPREAAFDTSLHC